MSFLKENWFIIVVGCVIISVGMFVFWRNNVPQEPVVIYKTTQPSQQQTNVGNSVNPAAHSHDHGTDHNHSHDTAPHSHTVQRTPNSETYDWRDQSPYDAPQPKTDPWKKLDEQQADTEESTNSSEESEVYPPPNWPLTKDPVLRAEYFHAQLLNQFGDIPEVHTVAEYQRKKALGEPVTIDEYITSLEASYHLWPNESIRKALESLRKEKAE